MRKHFTVWLITLIGLMGMSGASLQAQNPTSGTTGPLTWKYDTGTKTLTISGQGDMPNYGWVNGTQTAAPWETFMRTMTTLVIEEGVTTIGANAFSYGDELTSVNFPHSLKSIGIGSFSMCLKLSSLNLPDRLETIGVDAFFSVGVNSISIPASVTKISDGAFAHCTYLSSIAVENGNGHFVAVDGVLFNKDKTELIQYPAGRTNITYNIPAEVTKIGRQSFAGNNYLTSVSFPAGVIEIGSFAFNGCRELSSLALPGGLKKIGANAFGITKLTSATIPAGVETIGSNIFSSCETLTEIKVDAGNNHYTSVDGVLFNKAKTALLEYPIGRPGTEYTIPAGVTSIGNYAFSHCLKLTSVKIPVDLIEIGSGAFEYTGLTSLTIPVGVSKIEYALFYGCRELTSVTLPAGITEIGMYAFATCKKLKDLIVRTQTPPDIEDQTVFGGETPLSDVTLTVPKGTVEAYKAAGWTGFKEYKEAASTFDVQPASFDVDYAWIDNFYDKKIIEVTSDRPWKATLEGNVVTEFVVDDSNPRDIKTARAITGSGSRIIKLRVLSNDSTLREGKVIVETTDAGTPAKKEITIKQKRWYGVRIAGVGLTPDNYEHIDAAHGFTGVKSGSVTYVPSTSTITLEDAEIKAEFDYNGISWTRNREGTLVLKGKNKIEANYKSAISQENIAILKITGDGSLTALSNNPYSAIYSGESIFIGPGCSIDANSTIISRNGLIVIEDAEVHVKGATTLPYGAVAAEGNIEIKGSVKLLEPKIKEIKLFGYNDGYGYAFGLYTFVQGNTPCNEVRIGRELKLEAKAVKEEPVSIDGGEAKINVTSDAKWKVTVPAEAAAWVEVKGKTAGTNPNDSLVTLTVKPNLTPGTPREATILFETVAEKGLPAKQEVKITQEGSNFLAHWVSIYDTTLHFTAKKDTLKMKITSNTDWEISVPNSGEWLRIVKDGATNGDFKLEGKLAAKDTLIKLITIANNDEYTSRNAKITFKTKDGRFTQELIAVQDGKFRIKLPAKKTLDLDHVPANKETVQTFEIRSEEPWTLDISALTNLRTKYLFNGLPWLTVETSPLTGGGVHDSIVKVTIAANTAVAARGAKLDFKNASGTSMGKFNLKQDAATPAPTPGTPSTPSNQGTTRPTTPVIVSITRITLDKTEIVVDGNTQSIWLTTIISPSTATNKVIKWTSSDSAVASVSDRGLVTIHKKGKAVITATTTDGSGKSATCSILVRSTVSNVLLPEARIYTADGRLYLTLPNAASVRIYNLNGTLVRTFNAPAGETSVTLPQGVYVVKAGAKTEKVVVQ